MPVKPIKFPRLYKRTKRGSIAWYQITVFFDIDSAEKLKSNLTPRSQAKIVTEKASTLDGLSQSDTYVYKKGKNIGKANETTMYQQANSEAQSMYNRQLDGGYKPEMPSDEDAFNTDASGAIKPMLAGTYDKDKHTDFPYYVQPKLDGVRCLAKWENGEIVLTSRKGKPLNIPHVKIVLESNLPKDVILDGELYVHKKLSFQEIVSATKKLSSSTTLLQYCVYDIVDMRSSFEERLKILKGFSFMNGFVKEGTYAVEIVRTQKVQTVKDLNIVEDAHVQSGYEGVMVRHLDGKYTPGFRSKDLLKLKRFEDAEFKIVGVVEATGRDAGTAIFTCITKEGNEFNCRPQGTFEERSHYWKNRKKLIGKKLTVKFQGKSDDGVPRFPVGIALREFH